AGVTLRYGFLHEGILRQFLCTIGRMGGEAALYWRYGCWFHDTRTNSSVRVRQEPCPTAENPARGQIVIEARGPGAGELVETVRKAIEGIRLGPEPEVTPLTGTLGSKGNSGPEHEPEQNDIPIEKRVQITDPPVRPDDPPEVYISYAWGDKTPEGLQRGEIVDVLWKVLESAGYGVRRDTRSTRPGDSIRAFMRRIGRAQRVVVVVSAKYLTSDYCMGELLYLYRDCQEQPEEFQQRAIALVIDGSRFAKTIDLEHHVEYWRKQLEQAMGANERMGPLARSAVTDTEIKLLQDIHTRTASMLPVLADAVMPQGFEAIRKDGFKAVLERLKQDI
ncbi:MAG TPA: toll/interleukin-1 receptor domain-containing protein, partial [Candidatus Limnocylindria bacterium]|nr:toll/interleukin-1 receptor domain-containing protein [Candidatus Limnocylindria bacterium]